MSTADQLASLYSSRDGLPPDVPTFVGRTDTLGDLFRRLSSPWARPSVAILGSRRIGKSSLLKQILSGKFRERFLPGSASWKCMYLDCSSAWKGFDDFRRRLLQRVSRECEVSSESLREDESLEDILANLLADSENPLFAILDEFDYIAPELQKEEQAELRAAINNVPQFAILVGMAHRPGDVLEYVGDVVSDLASVLHIAQPTLSALSEAEARSLIRVGRRQAELAEDTDAESELLPRMGTHPLLVQAGCYGWYSVAGTRRLQELAFSEREAAFSRVDAEIGSQLRHLQRIISGDAREILEGQFPQLPATDLERARRDLDRLGLPKLPARREPIDHTNAEGGDSVLELTLRIDDLNRKHQRLTGRPESIFRPTALVTNDAVFLRRAVACEEDFKRFVEALARLLYDGSDGVTTRELQGKIKPKLPRCCYQHDRSLLVHLVCLRNHYIHLPVPDKVLAAEYLKSVGDVFERYAGNRAPSAPELENARRNLLTAANLLVTRLAGNLPLTNEIQPDTLFG